MSEQGEVGLWMSNYGYLKTCQILNVYKDIFGDNQ